MDDGGGRIPLAVARRTLIIDGSGSREVSVRIVISGAAIRLSESPTTMASNPETDDIHAVPSYWVCIHRIYNSTVRYIKEADNSTSYSPADFYRNLKRHGDVSTSEIQLVLALALLWTLLRYWLTWKVFTVSVAPLCDSLY